MVIVGPGTRFDFPILIFYGESYRSRRRKAAGKSIDQYAWLRDVGFRGRCLKESPFTFVEFAQQKERGGPYMPLTMPRGL